MKIELHMAYEARWTGQKIHWIGIHIGYVTNMQDHVSGFF